LGAAVPGAAAPDAARADADVQLLRAWHDRYARGDRALGQRSGAAGWQAAGRLELVQSPVGDQVIDAAGLTRAAGTTGVAAAHLDGWTGPVWFGVTGRLAGRLLKSGRAIAPALTYPDWPTASGRPPTGVARTSRGAWRLEWPRLAAGVQLGRWSLAAGWSSRRVGPGSTGGLTLSEHAPSFAAVTLRRTAPFKWHGVISWLGPDHLLVRAGQLAAQEVAFEDEAGRQVRWDHPWFLEWLVTWNHTPWLRTTVTHAALAVPRDGTLWPDLPQVLFPRLGATQSETERGPVTDRIFALQFEARWRRAPWPLLPAAAGRAYWEYGGEDYNPSGILSFLPQISAPASVAGLELISERWDLELEYAELRHETVLWYGHGDFRAGYTQEGWVLGLPLGGGGESFAGAVRWRPRAPTWEIELRGSRATWEQVQLPGTAERTRFSVSWRSLLPGPTFGLSADWIQEEATVSATTARDDWLAFALRVGI
jgi:hypothetical protein